jgi:hypothetical protein
MTEEFDTATATGRLMLTMLSGFAAHERDQIRERSMAGTDRLARAGAWLGGIVPYGYRKEGEDKEARIVISEEKMPEVGIADFLNMLRVPCSYARDGRLLLRGKRKQKTSGLWRAARIRNMLINATYMGRHEYRKRAKVQRQTIVREVPAIVDEATWQKAQQVLKSNFLFGIRGNKHLYLLRGMAKCGLCGLSFIGTHTERPNDKVDSYYRCNGKHGTRGIYGKEGKRCPAKDVNGIFLEDAIWNDIEGFLRNPGEVAEILRQKIAARTTDRPPSSTAAAWRSRWRPKRKSAPVYSGCFARDGSTRRRARLSAGRNTGRRGVAADAPGCRTRRRTRAGSGRGAGQRACHAGKAAGEAGCWSHVGCEAPTGGSAGGRGHRRDNRGRKKPPSYCKR